MPISKQLEYLPIEKLLLDPLNPRLGRDKRREGLDQAALLNEMSLWTLDELIDSFAQAGGFWTQDALIVVEEEQVGNDTAETRRYIVIEGNRRLAALKLLYGSLEGSIEPLDGCPIG